MTAVLRTTLKRLALGLALLGMALRTLSAQTQVNDAWVRATVPASRPAARS